ncbi:MAG: response regulator [Elusimicrobia bacterium]|nr:response regulator [Elusimicrobiota bacterium]
METKKRILIADDDADLVLLLAHDLAGDDYEVLSAYNGADALALAKTEDPDLILLDVMMPDLSGYHVAGEIYALRLLKPPAIIIMTGREIEDEAVLARIAGVAAVMKKPFELKILREKIKELLG